MRLLIDQDIARSTALSLRVLGHDAVSASELGMAQSTDAVLIEIALREQRIVVTLDHDYHQILATNAMLQPSVIFLREKSPTAAVASELIHNVCSLYAENLIKGCLLTCSRKFVRMRTLPIVRR